MQAQILQPFSTSFMVLWLLFFFIAVSYKLTLLNYGHGSGRLHLKGIDNVFMKHEVEAPSGVEGTEEGPPVECSEGWSRT